MSNRIGACVVPTEVYKKVFSDPKPVLSGEDGLAECDMTPNMIEAGAVELDMAIVFGIQETRPTGFMEKHLLAGQAHDLGCTWWRNQ